MNIPFKLLKKIIFPIALVLSTVVSYADCCSSTFQGWSIRKGASNFKTDFKPSPEILHDEQPCTDHFKDGYCENGGRCYMRLAEPYCACTPQWTGIRCMEKALEGSYNVKNPTTTLPSTTAVPTRTKRPLINTEHPTMSCTGFFASDYCLNGGTCQKVITNHGVEYLCVCSHPYFGQRCMEKGLDGTYKTRIRRSVTENGNKTNFFRKYRLRSV